MTTLTNYARGTDGVAVSTANSGGPSGTAWDSVVTSASTFVTYSDDHPLSGELTGLRFQANASAGQAGYVAWGAALGISGGTSAQLNLLAGVYLTGAFPVEIPILRGLSSGAQRWRATILPTGAVRLRDEPSASVVTGATLLAPGSHYLVEVGASAVNAPPGGTIEARIYDGASGALLERLGPVSSVDMGGPVNELRAGFVASVAPATPIEMYMGLVRASTDGWIGPPSRAGSAQVDIVDRRASTGAVTQRRTVTATITGGGT